MELDVLKGIDFNKFQINTMIIENLLRENNTELHEFYDDIGYEITDICDHNEIVRKKKG